MRCNLCALAAEWTLTDDDTVLATLNGHVDSVYPRIALGAHLTTHPQIDELRPLGVDWLAWLRPMSLSLSQETKAWLPTAPLSSPTSPAIATSNYSMLSWQCPSIISTFEECGVAAASLNLLPPRRGTPGYYFPVGCYVRHIDVPGEVPSRGSPREVIFNVHDGGSHPNGYTSTCDSNIRCVCGVPPSPPPAPPPSTPPHPPPYLPGQLPPRLRYFVQTSGTCGADNVSTVAECQEAAFALGFRNSGNTEVSVDTVAYQGGSDANWYPANCCKQSSLPLISSHLSPSLPCSFPLHDSPIRLFCRPRVQGRNGVRSDSTLRSTMASVRLTTSASA